MLSSATGLQPNEVTDLRFDESEIPMRTRVLANNL